MIRKYFRLSGAELDNLGDEEFFDLAAGARFLQRQEIEAGKAGVLEALAAAFGK